MPLTPPPNSASAFAPPTWLNWRSATWMPLFETLPRIGLVGRAPSRTANAWPATLPPSHSLRWRFLRKSRLKSIAAARRWLAADRLGYAAYQCANPTRALKAAEWATIDQTEVPRVGLEMHLAVRTPSRRWACPASLVMSRLDQLMTRLFIEVGDSHSEERLIDRAVVKLNPCCEIDDLSVPFVTSDSSRPGGRRYRHV